MTLGEKLTKLRKEQNYTQEQLAEILEVSRQSVSKWESDLAYPETSKLKQLSKLYKCSIDYLLDDENEEPLHKKNSYHTKKSFELKNMSNKLFTLIWTVVYFVLMLIAYAFPVLKATIQYNPFDGFLFQPENITVNINVYQLLENGPSEMGNMIAYIGFFSALGILVIGIALYFSSKTSGLIMTRKILAIIELLIWSVMFLLFITSIAIGTFFILMISIINLLGIFTNKRNLQLA